MSVSENLSSVWLGKFLSDKIWHFPLFKKFHYWTCHVILKKYFFILLQGYTEEMIKKELIPKKLQGPKKTNPKH